MEPSIGRIVHYQSYGTPNGEYLPEPRAAIITELGDGQDVSLCIVNPTGLFFTRNVSYAGESPVAGCWNWPPRT